MARFCASCGTEVDDTAVFCPTCGQPIEDDAEAELPPAPAWPDPAATDLVEDEGPPPEESPQPPDEWADRPMARDEGVAPDAPTRVEERPPADEGAAPADRPHRAEVPGRSMPVAAPEDAGRSSSRLDLPITTPVTLSGWLIGVGSVLAVLGILVILVGSLLNVIDLLLLLALLAVAATVFFSAHLPAIPNLRLATLAIVLIAFGVALDRIGFRGGGVGELLLFLGSAAAVIGAIILELGRDQPLGGPQS
jgi:hypothetical protein